MKGGEHVVSIPKQISKAHYVLVSVYSSVHWTVAGDGSDGNLMRRRYPDARSDIASTNMLHNVQ